MSKFPCYLPAQVTEVVSEWLREDCPTIDIGGFVVGDKIEVAHLLCKSSTVLAGLPFAQAVFDHYGLRVDWQVEEGAEIDVSRGSKQVVAIVTGPCNKILLAERTALNILSRASGVAKAAREAVRVAQAQSWAGWVAGTRKTTPGFKNVEKYALVVGGAATHRMDLSHMVMLKDNHIWSSGSITNAVRTAKQLAGFTSKIEVECQSLEDALEAAEAGADIVMLDNFEPENLHIAAEAIKQRFPHILIEASGGITRETLADFMGPNIDVISQGALTQGYSCADYSLKIQKST